MKKKKRSRIGEEGNFFFNDRNRNKNPRKCDST